MGRTIKIRIRGKGVDTDAPTAQDLLAQVTDYLEILRGVEAAVAEDGRRAIEWRVVNASKNSPLGFELEAFPTQYGVDIEARVDVVVHRTAEGLDALQRSSSRPPFFTDQVLASAERSFKRLTNGLDLSEIDFGGGFPSFSITPMAAHNAAKNAKLALKPPDKPYKEFGSIEGFPRKAEKDRHGRSLLYVQQRLTGDLVKCILFGQALAKIGKYPLGNIYQSRRLVAQGKIYYHRLGKINHVDVVDVYFPRSKALLPTLDDIVDESFTRNLSSEEYIGRLRDGSL